MVVPALIFYGIMSSSATVPLLEDETLEFGDEDVDPSYKKGALTHPYVTFFHLAFRCSALFGYLFYRIFTSSFITSFVVIVLLLSMDFWTVKNITGRLMVGLRWWNYVDDEGKSHWVFESRKSRINERESAIFWTALILTPIVWILFFITALFSFNIQWLLLVMIALILSSSNLYGYMKCKIGTNQSVSSVTKNFFRTQVLQNAVSIVSRQATNSFENPPQNTV
ncbi:uncharacterized Golgi apparatus membrane protein-like protein CG5021 isoform X2 [Coccinella septempunctata]|uniref:uncharacterized Golgi apparatus membrane protein-like protein CG5021 isoform X2 n=1 Tax=Coccinella septempunctata TaxID=41139 RepID=UPI001D05FFA5|nr:uncharacterized Golgi apparatus membrane protein-like protein CG5021 isoform X2 [Coccinella septempunctata]